MKKNLVVWIVAAVVILALGVGGYVALNNANKTNNNAPTTQNTPPGTVNIQSLSFSPATISVNKGDTVTWQNDNLTIHDVVADDGSFNSGQIAAGGTYKYTFDTVGSFSYHCAIHPFMTGTVVVK